MIETLKANMRDQMMLIDKDIRKLEKAEGSIYELNELRKYKRLYMISKTKPIRLENGMVVNEVLLNQIMKKIPSNPAPVIDFTEGKLFIRYKTKYGEGRFVLEDISRFYSSWEIPERVLLQP